MVMCKAASLQSMIFDTAWRHDVEAILSQREHREGILHFTGAFGK